ncbi:hypothetical protein ANOBCDAF_04497 [Pleomorphomonas sp. T1.2MG-36]|uniref:hypothetical protein n=1 Tax=Pleomorphomonas sp. T1.2MG-36 TaxID=3041167 RepID=UPI0024778FDF|nr:hypothetical protein [Pleomorphomonas sp. T1.2MG-36]CAI9403822.1 hypothetical protein ANOBCDAF_04497 [Pleomorphomonas sp. T1.2MG-36]
MKHELTLDELLRDPLVLTVMRADRVHPERLRRELRAVGDRYLNGGRDETVPCWMAAATGRGEACAW